MQDGATSVIEMAVECPGCHQESVVRVATGNDVDTLKKFLVCVYCQNPWIEFLPGPLIGGPLERNNIKSE